MTLAGIVMEVSEVALENAPRTIDVSVLPAAKVTEVSAVAPENASLPIDVTLAGMVMEVSEVA